MDRHSLINKMIVLSQGWATPGHLKQAASLPVIIIIELQMYTFKNCIHIFNYHICIYSLLFYQVSFGRAF